MIFRSSSVESEIFHHVVSFTLSCVVAHNADSVQKLFDLQILLFDKVLVGEDV